MKLPFSQFVRDTVIGPSGVTWDKFILWVDTEKRLRSAVLCDSLGYFNLQIPEEQNMNCVAFSCG